MLAYACTVFLSAFLLFAVQPMIGKIILPWFGGSAAVWSTCLLFFQAALLAGYFYADRSTRWLKPKPQATAAYRSDGDQPGGAPHPAIPELGAHQSRRSVSAHPAAAHGNHRSSLPAALHHQPAAASLVCGRQTRRDPVSTVRAVQFRFAARAAQLSSDRRTDVHHARAGLWMVGDLRRVRRHLRGRGVEGAARGSAALARNHRSRAGPAPQLDHPNPVDRFGGV